VSETDTIVALSTPPGRSGIGVVRLSGVRALEIARLLLADKNYSPEASRVSLKNLCVPGTNEILDQALVSYFKAPHSFTGEDIIEFSCHGSPVILRRLIDFSLRFNARLADPGEFTLRALSNKRLNLSQAEAIRDLIDAQTDAAARQAARQLGGELSFRLQPFKDQLLDIIVPLESALEFVEDDLPEIKAQQFGDKLLDLRNQIEQLLRTFHTGHLLRDGLKITLAGRPNVGKSTIFNKLLLSDRAIVSAIPGTTRDSLSELININGFPVLLTDTAGIRQSADEIESLGVERTRRAMVDADLTAVVIDGSQPLTDEDNAIIDEIIDLPHLTIFNKSDLGIANIENSACLCNKDHLCISISARTGEGIEPLRAALVSPFIETDTNDAGLLITDARHFDLLQRTRDALGSSIELLEQRASEELVLLGLYNALHLLGEITGETTSDDVLGRIFATFCIGK
jgi:tRNA modification GTPase